MTQAAKADVVVLGAAGFLGHHVLRELRRREHRVIAVARVPPRLDPMEQVRWVELDLDHADLSPLEADTVIHVAEPNAVTSQAGRQSNVDRARRLLAAPFRRIVYVSSAVVYGDQIRLPRRETESVSPAGPYAEAKLAVEELMSADPRCAIVRVANAYGPGMSPQNVVSDILANLGTTGALRLRDLTPVRDFVHVHDVARGVSDVAESSLVGIFNVGTGCGTSIERLARLACVESGTPDRELLSTDARATPSTLVLDIERMRRELGWSPSVTIETGIAELIRERIK